MLLKTGIAVISLVSALALAHLFRFAPLSERSNFDYSLVWDRWLQRVCVVPHAIESQVSCSLSALDRQLSDSPRDTSAPLTEVERARQAGFSELEVLEYVEKEIKVKRKQGMSDADLAAHLFGSGKRK